MRTRVHLSLALLAIVTHLVATGCQSARYVLKEPEHGIVAIPEDSNGWPTHYREEAEKLMGEHFPQGYVIQREEEVVVGMETRFQESHDVNTVAYHEEEKRRSRDTIGSHGVTTTKPKTEYRIHYAAASSSPY